VDGFAAAGATVRINGQSTVAGVNGYFRFTNLTLDKYLNVLTVERVAGSNPGRFTMYRTFSATASLNRVRVEGWPRAPRSSFGGDIGGSITLGTDASLEVPGGSLRTAQGAFYSGRVSTAALLIEPDVLMPGGNHDRFPGSPAGQDAAGNRVMLLPYAMGVFELTGTDGALHIDSSLPARLLLPVTTLRSGQAPDSLRLWHLDSASGLWRSRGFARLMGNRYSGWADRNGYWCVAASKPAAYLTTALHDSRDSLPVPLVPYRIGSAYTDPASFGYTDSLGVLRVLVPTQQALPLQTLDYCRSLGGSATLPAIPALQELGPRLLMQGGLATVQGRLLRCAGGGMPAGLVELSSGGIIYRTTTDAYGNYRFRLVGCAPTPGTVSLRFVEPATLQSTVVNVALVLPLTQVTDQTICDPAGEEFISYTLDGVAHRISSLEVGDSLGMRAVPYTSSLMPQIYFTIAGRKSNPSVSARLQFNTINTVAGSTWPSAGSFNGFVNSGNNIMVTFDNNLPAVGGLHSGRFQATYTDTTGLSHTVNGNYRLRRSP